MYWRTSGSLRPYGSKTGLRPHPPDSGRAAQEGLRWAVGVGAADSREQARLGGCRHSGAGASCRLSWVTGSFSGGPGPAAASPTPSPAGRAVEFRPGRDSAGLRGGREGKVARLTGGLPGGHLQPCGCVSWPTRSRLLGPVLWPRWPALAGRQERLQSLHLSTLVLLPFPELSGCFSSCYIFAVSLVWGCFFAVGGGCYAEKRS